MDGGCEHVSSLFRWLLRRKRSEKGGDGKRLLQQGAAGQIGIVRSTYGNDLQLRVHPLKNADSGRSIHELHPQIDDRCMDFVPVPPEKRDRLRTVCSTQHVEPMGVQQLPEDLAHRRLLVSDEDTLTMDHRQVRLMLAAGKLSGREIQLDDRPLPGFAEDIHESFLVPDDSGCRGKTQASRSSRGLCRKERLKYLFEDFRRDAAPGILYTLSQ